MIVRRHQLNPVHQADGPHNAVEALRIGDAGGLTQFGAHVHTLLPGGRASDRHWHAHEDELLFVLSGEVTVVENDGEHVLRPGDAACWPAGTPDAHQVLNRSEEPCSYFIVGSRVERDVVHYPELGQVLTIDGAEWELRAEDGTLLKRGTQE